MLQIRRFIAHHLLKEVDETSAVLDLSPEVVSTSGPVTEDTENENEVFLKAIHNAFEGRKRHSVFSSTSSTIFNKSLETYLSDSKSEDKTFYSFSKQSLEYLKGKIEKQGKIKGGYYYFADYYIGQVRYVTVVLVRAKEEHIFEKNKDGVFCPKPKTVLNIGNFAMGFRLNLAAYYSTEVPKPNYLALVPPRGNDMLSNYFLDWISAERLNKPAENTRRFIELLNHVELPQKEDESFMARDEFLMEVFQMHKGKQNRSVNLAAIGNHFYGGERKTYLIELAQEKGILVDDEFNRDSSTWKLLREVHAETKGIELTFEKDKYDKEEVRLVKGNSVIQITNAEIVAQVRAQLKI